MFLIRIYDKAYFFKGFAIFILFLKLNGRIKKVSGTKNMISIERARELIADKNMSDEEIDRVRFECRELAEIILEKYLDSKKKPSTENRKIVSSPSI